MKMRLKPHARADLLAIRAWGEDHWGPGRTRDFLEGLIETLEKLTAFPLMGRSRAVFLPGLRSIRYRGYVIFYLLEQDQVALVAVIHERRNQAALDFADQIEDG